MKLVINADDYGLSAGISDSIIMLLNNNAISNTTVMICLADIETECQKLIASNLSHRAGLHLQITAENHHNIPVSHPKDIPSLVDENGEFKPRELINNITPNELVYEWENQILKFIEVFDHKPSHIDTHHGIHRLSIATPVYLKLAQKYGVPVRGGQEVGQVDACPFQVKQSAVCESSWTGQNASAKALKEALLKKLEQSEDSVIELVTHPGFCNEQLMQASTWNTVRENDHQVLMQLAQENWYASQGIDVVRYPEL